MRPPPGRAGGRRGERALVARADASGQADGQLGAICALELAFKIAQCFNSHATIIHFTVFLITPCMDMHGYTLV